MQYRWQGVGQSATENFTTITTNVTVIPYTSGAIRQIIEFPMIDGSAIDGLSSMMDIKIYRQTGDGIAGDVLVKEFDIHYEIDKLGSDEEYE